MQSLNEKTWLPSVVDEVFTTINSTKGKTTAQLVEGDDVPYIAAAKTNNGCAGVYSSKPYPEWVSDGNAIVFVQLGDGAAGLAHYVPMPFIGMSGKTSCGYFQSLNKDNGIFIARCLSANKAFFSHGHSWTGNRLKKTKFMLPVTNSGEPDYEYMAEYTRQKRAAMLDKYHKYVEARIAELGELVEIPMLDEKEWDEFFIGDLFEVSRPKSRNKDDYDFGNTPFVASGALNNGVMKCCDAKQDEQLDAGNCITVSPVDGSTFYQPMDFLGRGGAGSSILMLRSDWLNLYLGQFIARTVRQTCSKYTYGHMGNKDSIKRERIMLPIDDSGKPDYEYMEQYAKNMMLRKYKQYLEFINRQNVTEVD